MSEFFQEGPVLENQYLADRLLKSYLKKSLPENMLSEIEPDLINLGSRVITDIKEMADDVLANEPELIQYNPWGKRIDEIKVSKGWKDLEKVSAEEGLIAIGYERKYEEYSRIYQFAKLYLFHPSSAIFTCPLAMTDGATKLIEVYGDEFLKNKPYKHLTSRVYGDFWTSGQWMTEKEGGSDVSRTSTIARFENGNYRLYGTKWFTSATTSQMAMTLARIQDEKGNMIPGGKGLSCFYLELRDENGNLNNISINRLKDKLGTKGLPTAELSLNGTTAKLVGDAGNGVKKIASLFNITRIYNSVSALGYMRRSIALLRDYSHKREAFGKKIINHKLHIESLANMECEFQFAFQVVFYTVALLGKEETGKASESDIALLRMLTPLIKLYTAKQGINIASEMLEGFGGAGYVEDTGLPVILRDSQVLSIWEGTTNILSLDTLRAIEKENSFEPFINNIVHRLEGITDFDLQDEKNKVLKAVDEIKNYFMSEIGNNGKFMETGARNFAFSLIKTFGASLMLEHAQWAIKNENEKIYLYTAKRLISRGLTSLYEINDDYEYQSFKMALG